MKNQSRPACGSDPLESLRTECADRRHWSLAPAIPLRRWLSPARGDHPINNGERQCRRSRRRIWDHDTIASPFLRGRGADDQHYRVSPAEHHPPSSSTDNANDEYHDNWYWQSADRRRWPRRCGAAMNRALATVAAPGNCGTNASRPGSSPVNNVVVRGRPWVSGTANTHAQNSNNP